MASIELSAVISKKIDLILWGKVLQKRWSVLVVAKNSIMQPEKKLYVLKISNPAESYNLLEMQDFLLTNLNTRVSIKDFIPKKKHSTLNIYKDEIGRSCYVRILSYIEGQVLARSKASKDLELSLGSLLGNLSKELQNKMLKKLYLP